MASAGTLEGMGLFVCQKQIQRMQQGRDTERGQTSRQDHKEPPRMLRPGVMLK